MQEICVHPYALTFLLLFSAVIGGLIGYWANQQMLSVNGSPEGMSGTLCEVAYEKCMANAKSVSDKVKCRNEYIKCLRNLNKQKYSYSYAPKARRLADKKYGYR